MNLLDSALAHKARRSPALRPPAIAAYRLLDRLLPAPPGPRVVANSMPKSGTHLLTSLLDELPGMRFSGRLVRFDAAASLAPGTWVAEIETRLARLRSSHYINAHMMFHQDVERAIVNSNVRLVTILRDPRAMVLSGAHYVTTARHMAGRKEALRHFPSFESALKAFVEGYRQPGEAMYFPEIGERYRRYVAWSGSDAGLTVRFEDLVGEEGGGSRERQLRNVEQIVAHIGHPTGSTSALQLAEQIFSRKSITFRSGSVDSWRRELDPGLARDIAERCQDSMRRLGYED